MRRHRAGEKMAPPHMGAGPVKGRKRPPCGARVKASPAPFIGRLASAAQASVNHPVMILTATQTRRTWTSFTTTPLPTPVAGPGRIARIADRSQTMNRHRTIERRSSVPPVAEAPPSDGANHRRVSGATASAEPVRSRLRREPRPDPAVSSASATSASPPEERAADVRRPVSPDHASGAPADASGRTRPPSSP